MKRRNFFTQVLGSLFALLAASIGINPQPKWKTFRRWNALTQSWESVEMKDLRVGEFFVTDDDPTQYRCLTLPRRCDPPGNYEINVEMLHPRRLRYPLG